MNSSQTQTQQYKTNIMTPQTSDATKGSIPVAHNLTITKKGDAP